MSKFGYSFLFIILNTLGVVGQTTPNLLLPDDVDGYIQLDITNLASDHDLGYGLMSVYVAHDHNTIASVVAVQGKFVVVENKLNFKPYFPFEIGLPYVVKLNVGIEEQLAYIPFQIGEKRKVAQAKVLSIFPTSVLLPENVLRFYIYFQTPMRQEEALQHIKLIDKDGNVDDHAFMKFKEELWSSDGKRLTILFDPGRIKKGVSTNMLLGPALNDGHQYKLRVSKEWQDVYGQNLIRDTLKDMTVVSGYRDKIAVNEWTVIKPKYNTKDRMVIEFDRIMDHALLQSMMELWDEDHNLVEGRWEIFANENQIQFIPSQKWGSGKFSIGLDTRLEDVAGNNLQNLLDHSIADKDLDEMYQYINFTI